MTDKKEKRRKPLPFRIACIRHCIEAARKLEVEPSVIEGAEQGLETLNWVHGNSESIKIVYAILKTFPEADIGEVL